MEKRILFERGTSLYVEVDTNKNQHCYYDIELKDDYETLVWFAIDKIFSDNIENDEGFFEILLNDLFDEFDDLSDYEFDEDEKTKNQVFAKFKSITKNGDKYIAEYIV